MIVLAGGFVIAVLVATLVELVLGHSKPQVAKAAAAMQVAVAARDLSSGTVLHDGDLRWQDWPAGSVYPGLIVKKADQRVEDAATGRLTRSFASGEPVNEHALVKQSPNIVADMLGDGMRAVALTVSAQTEAGGFVMPGDHVDIILTYRKTIHMDDEDDPRVKEMLALNLHSMASETILRNVRILAVDQSPEKPSANKDQGRVSRTVTVEAGKRDSEILALAPSLGTLTLALRKPGDVTPDEPEPNIVTDERITHVTEEIYSEAHKITGSANGNSVRMYNGFDIQDQQVGRP